MSCFLLLQDSNWSTKQFICTEMFATPTIYPGPWSRFSLPSTIWSCYSYMNCTPYHKPILKKSITLGTSFACFWDGRRDEQGFSFHERNGVGDIGSSTIPETLGREINLEQTLNRRIAWPKREFTLMLARIKQRTCLGLGLVALAGRSIPGCDSEECAQILSLGELTWRTENWKIHMAFLGAWKTELSFLVWQMSCLLTIKVVTAGDLLTTSRVPATVVEDKDMCWSWSPGEVMRIQNSTPGELQKPLKGSMCPWVIKD